MLLCFVGTEESLLLLLCNEVAPHTNQLQSIAINLNISPIDFERIRRSPDSEQDKFMEVFRLWNRRGTPPFSLNTILQALESPSVDEHSLANELRTKYNVPK